MDLQLNLIIDMLGTPSLQQMKYACQGAKDHVLRSPFKAPNIMKLFTISRQASTEAVHLMAQMLTFDPVSRLH